MLLFIGMMNAIFNLQVNYSNMTTILLRVMPTWVICPSRAFVRRNFYLERCYSVAL